MIKMKKLAMILSMTLLAVCCSLGATACDIFKSTCKEHNLVETVIKEATCTEDGKAVLRCEACGEEEEKTISATGHSLKTTVTTAATCEADGVKTTKCQNGCGYTVSETIAATGHDVGEEKNGEIVFRNPNSYEANCQQKAKCGDCGKEYGEKITSHEPDIVPVSAQAPTCTEDGWKAYEYCRDEHCTYTTKVTISKTWHDVNFKNANSYKATCQWGAYCGVCRTTYTEPLEHEKENTIVQVAKQRQTCDEDGWEAYEYCTECTYTTIKVLPKYDREHVVVDAEKVEATCTEVGYQAGKMCAYCLKTIEGRAVIPALGHDGKREGQTDKNGKITYIKEASKIDTCTSKGYCDICGLEYGTPTHDVGTVNSKGELVFEVKGSKAATCTDAAFCAKCGSSYGEALGHSLESVEAALYCDKAGYYAHEKCTREGCKYDTKEVAAPLGHVEVVVKAKAPTCTEDGAMEGIQCSRCEKYLVYPTTILALGHDGERVGQEDERDLLSSASSWKTCTMNAYCGICHQYYGETRGSHDLVRVEEKSPTCFQAGWYEYEVCTVKGCSYSTYESNFLPRLQHEYMDYKRVEPTCTMDGYEECRICVNCEERPVIKAFGHDETGVRNKNSKLANCVSRGYCGDCESYFGEYPKGEHNPGVAATCTSPRVCLDCGEILEDALEHHIKFDGTCARCGEQIEAIVKKQDEE